MNSSSLAGHILELFGKIELSNYPADQIALEFFRTRKYLGSHDRRFISEAIFGMVRHRRFIESLLEQFIIDHPGTADLDTVRIRYLPLYVAYTIAVEDQPKVLPSFWKIQFPQIDLQQYVEWLYKNRLLDFLPKEQAIRLAVKYSFQDWMVKEWMNQVGIKIEQLLQVLNTPANITLRVNSLRATRDECQKRLLAEGIQTEPTPLSPMGLIASKRFNAQASQSFKDGWYEMQDEGSQLISFFTNPQPGEIVVDSCAGAGGKSLHMAELMQNDGEIIAVDVENRRLAELDTRAKRAGIGIIKTHPHEKLQPENLYSKADVVLVDAPCSGVGTIRRSPWLKWSVSESLVQHYSEKQKEILKLNARFVKPGGKLIYSTCSLFHKENGEIVNSFLESSSGFQLLSSEDSFSKFGLSSTDRTLTIYPHCSNTDGFFLAILQRVS